jgi:Serine carboxypeptidase S28
MKTLPLLALGLLNGPKDDPRVTADSALKSKKDYDPSKLYSPFNLSVPIDHFHNDSKYAPHALGTFPLRYWFDSGHYKPGGPVILLAAGETDGVDRLPILQKGIVSILSRATNGIGVVLEHRYYGQSFPVKNLSIRSLRFLDTQQALADTAFFARNVKFPGLETLPLNPDRTPWIVYGGSYAGSFAV